MQQENVTSRVVNWCPLAMTPNLSGSTPNDECTVLSSSHALRQSPSDDIPKIRLIGFILHSHTESWEDRKDQHTHIHELLINLDNGPELGSEWRQFIKPMIEFGGRYPLKIHLVYYPPYHREYNPVERVWGVLENHWNGTLLTDRETAIEWAQTMAWKGISAIVKVLAGTCETGVKVGTQAFNSYKNVSVVTNHFPSATW